jgi:hypothetical protein
MHTPEPPKDETAVPPPTDEDAVKRLEDPEPEPPPDADGAETPDDDGPADLGA